MICPRCGTALPDGAKFCGVCGSDLSAPQSVPAPQKGNRKALIIILIIAAILLAGGGVTAAIILTSGGNTSHTSEMLSAANKYLLEMKYEQAIVEFDKIIEIDPMNVDAYLGKAEALIALGREDEALDVLREAYLLTGDQRIADMISRLTVKPEPEAPPESEPEPESTEAPDHSDRHTRSQLRELLDECKPDYETDNIYNEVTGSLIWESKYYEVFVDAYDDAEIVCESSSSSSKNISDAYNTLAEARDAMYSHKLEISEEEYLRHMIHEFAGDKVVAEFCPADYDNNGKIEAFAFVSDNMPGEYGECMGVPCFVTSDGVEIVDKYGHWVLIKDAVKKLDFGARRFFALEEYITTGGPTYIYGVENGDWYMAIAMGSGLERIDGTNDFIAHLSILDAVYDTSMGSYMGRTFKPYYFCWDKGFKEYGGIAITEEQFRRCDGADKVLDMISEAGGTVDNIIYRSNDLININYHSTDDYGIDYDNATLKLEGRKVTLLSKDDTVAGSLKESSYGGIYNLALDSRIAVTKEFPVEEKTPSSVVINGRTYDISNGALRIGWCDLSDADLKVISGLTELKELSLESCGLTDISFLSDLKKLEKLDLYYNKNISDISALSGLTRLTELNLNQNNISDISVLPKLTKLTDLRIGGNNISDFSVLSGMKQLKVLNIYGNKTGDISALAGLTQLVEIDADYNGITDISPLSNLKKLERLSLNSNAITDISAIANLKNLTELHIDISANNEGFKDISVISGLTGLVSLHMNNVRISDISWLSSFKNLEDLQLNGCGIENISGLAACKKMKVLNLGFNNFSDLSYLSSLTGLVELDLSSPAHESEHNYITDISALSGLVSLERLNLWGNQIRDISPLSGLTALQHLDLSYNPCFKKDKPWHIYDTPPSDPSALSKLKNLYSLDLRDTGISDISAFSSLTDLHLLVLDDNEVEDISALSALTNLTTLHLSENNVSDISPLSGLKYLDNLTLDNNPLTDVSPLFGLSEIKWLWLPEGVSEEDLLELEEYFGISFRKSGNDYLASKY